MSDPRAANCRVYHVSAAGKVDGVELKYEPIPSAKYELIKAELVPEGESGDTTVAMYQVFDKDGLLTSEKVWLAWCYTDPKGLSGFGLPGNPNGQHMIISTYPAHDGTIGPLALFPGDVNHNPIGDIIGGLGLPDNRHVCYRLIWRERGAAPGPEPTPTPVTVDLTATNDLLARLLAAVTAQAADLAALVKHLGTPAL